MDTIEILRRARDGWSDKSRRCAGHLATDAKGHPVQVFDQEACKWCAVGWMKKESGRVNDNSYFGAYCALNKVLPSTPGKSAVVAYNDSGHLTREHWDKAIRSLGGEP
jgi:hypothetical protein